MSGRGSAGQSRKVTSRAGRIGASVLAVACWLVQACGASSTFTFDDEFSGPSGARPPANWSYDIGNRGWGNRYSVSMTPSAAPQATPTPALDGTSGQ